MNKRGVALLFCYIVMVVLATLGAAFLSNSLSEKNFTLRFVHSTRAFWLAEAGIHKGLWALNNNDWTGWNVDPGTGDRTTQESLGVAGASGEYIVTIDSGKNNMWAWGFFPSIAAVNLPRTITVTLAHPSNFTYATFGQDFVNISGNGKTDSYNSDLNDGEYGGANISSNGDVGTNGIAAGAITLTGNAYVDGDVSTGSGGTIRKTGNGDFSGEESHESEVVLDPVEVPGDLTSLTNGGNINIVGNNSQVWGEGKYKFSSLSLSGNSKLTLNGNVKIYLTSTASGLSITGNGQVIVNGTVKIYTDGNVNISGNGVANNSYHKLPTNFKLYGTSTASDVQISGNGALRGTVYAPEASIRVTGNGDIFGYLIGKSFTDTGNGTIHYDEALAAEGGPATYSITSWREL
jgi:hypothetical protein